MRDYIKVKIKITITTRTTNFLGIIRKRSVANKISKKIPEHFQNICIFFKNMLAQVKFWYVLIILRLGALMNEQG